MTSATLTECVLVPMADAEDARTTCRVLGPYQPDRVVAIHVIEKADGAPDKAGVEQRQERAKEIFAAVEEGFEGAETDVETEIRYGTDVADTIVEAAGDHDATAIVFSPRKGGRWVRLLTGDVALSLITESDRPVVVLPKEVKETVTDGGGVGEPAGDGADVGTGTDAVRSEGDTDANRRVKRRPES